ncbi:MAG TPA: hypothetical protein VIW68_00910, partial [Candidatus Sulfotelmatobacter sp.]
NSFLISVLKGRGFKPRRKCRKIIAALQFSEKLAFGWRIAFSAAIRPSFSNRALAPEASQASFSANCLAAAGLSPRANRVFQQTAARLFQMKRHA